MFSNESCGIFRKVFFEDFSGRSDFSSANEMKDCLYIEAFAASSDGDGFFAVFFRAKEKRTGIQRHSGPFFFKMSFPFPGMKNSRSWII